MLCLEGPGDFNVPSSFLFLGYPSHSLPLTPFLPLSLVFSLREERWRRSGDGRRSRIQRGKLAGDKAKAHEGKRGPYMHRHIYPPLSWPWLASTASWCWLAQLASIARDRAASCKSRPWAKETARAHYDYPRRNTNYRLKTEREHSLSFRSEIFPRIASPLFRSMYGNK